MYYISTRGNGGKVTSAQAIKQGIAADGGLFTSGKTSGLFGAGTSENARYELFGKSRTYSR